MRSASGAFYRGRSRRLGGRHPGAGMARTSSTASRSTARTSSSSQQTLQTTRDPDVFALGDCAACPWPEGKREGATVPPRAQAAHQQATLLVRTVAARLDGRPLPEFRFRDYGSLVSLGELSAVGTLMGILIGGSMLVQGLIARVDVRVAVQAAPASAVRDASPSCSTRSAGSCAAASSRA